MLMRCLAGLLLGPFALSIVVAKDDNPPNIVFFLADDQRNDFLGCAGHPILQTPHIDRLAREGVRFEKTFVTTSICAASRASILTGLHERTHGFTFGTPPIATKHTNESYPAVLRRAGYRTGFVGKFGVGVEAGQRRAMFDVFHPLGRSPYHKKQKGGGTRHVSEIAGDRASDFLRSSKKGQPFCLSVSFNAPHAEDGDKKNHYPWPKAVDGLYDDVEIPAPRYSGPEVFESQPEFLRKSMNRDRWFWRWDTREKYQRNVRAYYRMISGIDGVIGRVLAELAKLDLDDNTVVIYAADNGYYKGARGFAGKWSHYEDSLRVPLVIYDPRAEAERRGKTVGAMVLNIDIPATILAYAGEETPAIYRGRSLVPWMRGETPASWRADFFCEHLFDHGSIPKWEGVRGERWVYARYFEQDPVFEFLHDLRDDPAQLRNFATDPSSAAVLQRLRKRCDELRGRLGGPFDAGRIKKWREARRKKSEEQREKRARRQTKEKKG